MGGRGGGSKLCAKAAVEMPEIPIRERQKHRVSAKLTIEPAQA
jgi:hypothetical protein